jgi:hypothetical protein
MVGCAVKPRSPAVATCRQTVEALLAPLPPLGSGCLRFDSRRFRFPGRSHLSPDGGGFTRAAVHRLAADVYDSTADDSGSSAVATCRQTVEALLAPHPPLGSGCLRFDSGRFDSSAVATCRQTVEALLAPLPPLGSGWLRFDSRRFRFLGRSHLSPDGGGFPRAASTAWQRMATIWQRTIRFLGRSHLSPDGGSVTRAASTAWQRMATIRQPAIQVPRT